MKLQFSWKYLHRTFNDRFEASRAMRGRSSFQPLLQKLMAAILRRSESCMTTSPAFSTLSGMWEIGVDHKVGRGPGAAHNVTRICQAQQAYLLLFDMSCFTQAYVHTIRRPTRPPVTDRKMKFRNKQMANLSNKHKPTQATSTPIHTTVKNISIKKPCAR